MADPFSIQPQGADGDFWKNLMTFGLATMQGANARTPQGFLANGPGALGPIGAGGLTAMQSAKENEMARAQSQLYGAEATGKIMNNAVSLSQINMQRMGIGLPPIQIPGMPNMPTSLPGMMNSPDQNTASAPNTPPSNSSGMSFSPTAGNMPTAGGQIETPQKAPQSSYNPQRLAAIAMGRLSPSSPEEAGAAALWAKVAGNEDREKGLNQYALAGPTAGAQAGGKYPFDLALAQNTPRALSPGESIYSPAQGGIVAQGQQKAVAGPNDPYGFPQGTEYLIPAKTMNQPSQMQPNQPAQGNASFPGQPPLGVRNNNPGNIRPNGDQWQGMTGENQGYLTFESPEAGIRAASLNLQSYNRKGINTPMSIAANWAPAGDKNDVGGYAFGISQQLGVKPDQPLNLNDPAVNQAVLGAIFRQENGVNPYPPQIMSSGVQAAFTPQKAGAAPAPAAAPQPFGATPVQTSIAPGLTKELEKSGEDLGERQAEIRMKARLAPVMNSNINMLIASSQNSPTGPLAEDITEWRKYLQSITGVSDATAGKIKDAESTQKIGMQLLGDYTKQVMQGSRIAFNEFPLFQKAVPNIENSKQGISQLGHMMQGTADYNLALEREMDSYLSSPKSGGSMRNFDEGAFADKVSPMAFQMARMSDEERTGVITNLQKTRQGRLLAQSLSRQIQYGISNNLFQR